MNSQCAKIYEPWLVNFGTSLKVQYMTIKMNHILLIMCTAIGATLLRYDEALSCSLVKWKEYKQGDIGSLKQVSKVQKFTSHGS